MSWQVCFVDLPALFIPVKLFRVEKDMAKMTEFFVKPIGDLLSKIGMRFYEKRFGGANQPGGSSNSQVECLSENVYAKVYRLAGQSSAMVDVSRSTGTVSPMSVSDVITYYRHCVYDRPLEKSTVNFRTAGRSDMVNIFPWIDDLKFPDRAAIKIDGYLSQTCPQPTSSHVSVCNAYNSVDGDNHDFSIKAKRHTLETRLVVDLSLAGEYLSRIEIPPRAYVEKFGSGEKVQVGVVRYREFIYSASAANLEADDILVMSFC